MRDLKSLGRKSVWVQVPPVAQDNNRMVVFLFFYKLLELEIVVEVKEVVVTEILNQES